MNEPKSQVFSAASLERPSTVKTIHSRALLSCMYPAASHSMRRASQRSGVQLMQRVRRALRPHSNQSALQAPAAACRFCWQASVFSWRAITSLRTSLPQRLHFTVALFPKESWEMMLYLRLGAHFFEALPLSASGG